ncbi:hypothetical protein IW147_000574 [Coemansia sp. RSA 720]|nr:hypothetical protein IW147_000574 [Coemansia sp. RSA 720]
MSGVGSQDLFSVSVDQAIQSISTARSCVLLVGPGLSKDIGIDSALDFVAKTANASVSDVASNVLGAISSYCGRLLSVPNSPVREMIAELVADQHVVRVYTDDVHMSMLYPTNNAHVSDIESRTVCIHGQVTQFACKACTTKSQLTQAVLFKAMNGKHVSCGVCGTMGELATSSDSTDCKFVPDVLCAQENERLALEMAQSDAATPIDLLLVLGANSGVSESWSAIASVLSLAATQTLVVGQIDSVPHALVDGDKTSVVCMGEDAFAQQYLARSVESDYSLDIAAVADISLADMSLADASSTAESGDDRQLQLNHTASGAGDPSGQQRGYRRTKNRNREKTNLSHLLNFSLPERAPPPLSRPKRRTEGAVSERQAEINRSLFINANFRFVLKPMFWQNFMAVATRPDMQLRPEWIERVIMPISGETTNCPICLSPPIAARVTRCGHVFCLPCILRHIACNSDGKRHDIKCPICWYAISSDELLPVHFWATQYVAGKPESVPVHLGAATIAPSMHITMQLMKRLRGSTICLPRSCAAHIYTNELVRGVKNADEGSRAVFDSSRFPWSFSDRALTFARCMLATCSYGIGEYERELHELQVAKTDKDADSESRLFIESAIMNVEAVLTELQTPSKAERRREELAKSEQSTSSAANDPLESDSDNVADDFLYFYQADDGQHIYMHPLHMRVLAHNFGGYSNVPETLEIKLKRSVESMITDEVRQRFRFLDHLSLRCELVIIEPELKHLVSHETFEKFRQQLSHHDKQHIAREQSAAREEARAEIAHSVGYEGGHEYAIVADPDPIGSDDSSFPALDGTLSANTNGPKAVRPRKANGLWPREPASNGLSNGAYNALWDEFEQAASRSPRSSYDLELDSEYNGHDLEDFSVPVKTRDPLPSAKSKKGKNKGVKLVLSGSSARRSR